MNEKKTIDIPFVFPPSMRMVVRIDESHEVDGVTVIDKCTIETIYVKNQSLEPKVNKQ